MTFILIADALIFIQLKIWEMFNKITWIAYQRAYCETEIRQQRTIDQQYDTVTLATPTLM